jgi:hypothetical protein
LKQTHVLRHVRWQPTVHAVRCTLRSGNLKSIVTLHPAKWHVHCCYVDAPCDLARQLATSISSRFWPSAQLLRGLVVDLSAAYFVLAAMSSRKRGLSATASSASSNATGARSASSYCSDEQGSTQPENDLGAPLEAVEQRVSSIAGESARGRGGESSMAKVEEHIAAAQPAVPLQVVSAASPPEAVEQRNSSIVDHRSIFCEKCQKLVVDGPGHQKRCQHAARKCTVDELVILAARRAAKRARSEVSSVDRAQNKGAAKRARSEVSPVDRAQDALGEDVRRGSTSSAPKVGRCTILESQAQRRGRGRQGRGIVAEVEHAAAAQPDTQLQAPSAASGKRNGRVMYCVTCQGVRVDGYGHKRRSGTSQQHMMRRLTNKERDEYEASRAMWQPRQRCASASQGRYTIRNTVRAKSSTSFSPTT